MTVATLQTLVRDITNTNSTTFTDADILRHLNIAYGHRILDILRLQVDRNASQTEVKTNLVSVTGLSEGDSGYNGEYAFPVDLVRPLRMEITYDGENWYPCKVYDINENTGSEHYKDSIQDNFSETDPYVRFDRDSYFIRPLPETSVTNGLHIWYEYRQTDLTTGSPDFEANLHDLLAYDVTYMELLKHPSKFTMEWRSDFRTMRTELQERFNEFYRNRFKRSLKLKDKFEDFS